MNLRHPALALLLLVVSTAAAAVGDDSALLTRRLANGLEVLVYPDPVVAMVTAELVVRNGASYETPATSGLAHLYEHLFWPDPAHPRAGLPQVKDRGISFNAQTRNESTQFYLVSPGPALRDSLTFLREALRSQDLSIEHVAAEKQIVLAEIRQADANPYTLMTRRVHELLFPRNRTFKSPLGVEPVVENAFVSDLASLSRRFAVAANMALVVAGDCDPESVFRFAAELFGDLPAGSAIPAQSDPGPAAARTTADVIVSPQVEDVAIKLAWRGPGVETDRAATYAADLLSTILEQPGGRFQRTLVDTGLAIGVDVTYATQRRTGVTTVLFKSSPAKAREALRAVRREIAALAEPGYFTDKELANARSQVIADELFQREDLARYSHSLGFWWASAGTDYLQDRLGQTRRTGRAEITAYVRRYLQGTVSAAVALVPEGRNSRVITTADLLAK